jgi:hypothetical protein
LPPEHPCGGLSVGSGAGVAAGVTVGLTVATTGACGKGSVGLEPPHASDAPTKKRIPASRSLMMASFEKSEFTVPHPSHFRSFISRTSRSRVE